MSRLICPLLGIAGLGSSFLIFGTVSVGTQLPNTLIDHLLIRGISNIALGIWAYETALNIKEHKFTRLSHSLLLLLKWTCYILVIIYTYFKVNKAYALIPVILLLIETTLTFNNTSYNIPFNCITGLLVKLSLPIYLTHGIIRSAIDIIWGKDIDNWKIWIVVIVICLAFAYVFMIFTDYLFKQIEKTKKLLIH